jgi:hypothetical protein
MQLNCVKLILLKGTNHIVQMSLHCYRYVSIVQSTSLRVQQTMIDSGLVALRERDLSGHKRFNLHRVALERGLRLMEV